MRFQSILIAVFLSVSGGALAQSNDHTTTTATTFVTITTGTASTATTSTSATISSATSATATPSTVPDADNHNDASSGGGGCQKSDIVAFPFCTPKAHSIWRTDRSYNLTWDSDVWDQNSTVFITLNYASPGSSGHVVDFWELPNARGFQVIHPKDAWLYNQTLKDRGVLQTVDFQDVYFAITNDHASTAVPHTSAALQISGKDSGPPSSPSSNTNNDYHRRSLLALAVALPLAFVLILLAVCGTHFALREKHRIGPIAIGGGSRRFEKGYSGRKERALKTKTQYAADAQPSTMVAAPPKAATVTTARDWELDSVRGGI